MIVEEVVIETSSYTVEHYQLKVGGINGVEADYVIADTESFTDISVDTDVVAQIKDYTGFEQSTEIASVTEGKVTSDGSLVLKVYYDRVMVAISYNEDGGTEIPDTFVQFGASLTLPGEDSTTKSGYIISGWEYNETEYELSAEYVVDTVSPIEFNAIWIEDTFKVIFYDGWGDPAVEYDVHENDTVEESLFPNDELESAIGYEKNEYISPTLYSGENAYVHEIKKNWYYNIPGTEEWILFTPEVTVTSDIVVDGILHVRQRAPYLTLELGLNNKFISQDFAFSTFYEETVTDANGNEIPGTRALDSAKDILWESFNTQYGETLFQGELSKALDGILDKIREKDLIIDEDNNILVMDLFVRYSQIIGEEKLEEYIVDNAKETIRENEELKPSIIKYYEEKAESGNVSSIEEIKELFANEGIRDALVENEDAAIEELIALGEIILDDSHEYKEHLDQIKNDEVLREQVIDEVTQLLAHSGDYSEFDFFIEYVIIHLDATGELDGIVDEIIEQQYRPTLDKFVSDLINEQTFEITPDTSFILSAFEMQIKDYSFDKLIADVPEEIFKIYPREKLEAIYTNAYNEIISQIEAGKALMENGENAVVDSGMTFVVNPVDDIYRPLRDRFVELVADSKIGNNYYYAENEYLQELIRLTSVEELFDTSNAESGYKLKAYSDYYTLILKLAIIGDDALCWYRDELSGEELDSLILGYEELFLGYANGIGDAFEGNAENENIVTKLIAAFKEKAPSVADKIGNWYLSSPLNREYSSDDYAKLRTAVKNAFAKIDYTTDEAFDYTYTLIAETIDVAEGKITPENINKIATKLSNLVKVDGNTYTASFKGKTVKIVVGSGIYTVEFAGKVIEINITGEGVYTATLDGKTIEMHMGENEYVFSAGDNVITLKRSIQ